MECEAQQCSCDRITGFAHKQLLCEISPFRSKTPNPAQHTNNGVCGDKSSANGAGAAVLGGGPRTCTTAHIRLSAEEEDGTTARRYPRSSHSFVVRNTDGVITSTNSTSLLFKASWSTMSMLSSAWAFQTFQSFVCKVSVGQQDVGPKSGCNSRIAILVHDLLV